MNFYSIHIYMGNIPTSPAPAAPAAKNDVFDAILGLIPGASLIQRAVLGETVDATDFIPGAKFLQIGSDIDVKDDIADAVLNLIPGASLVQRAVLGETVDATDFMPGSKFAQIGADNVVKNRIANAFLNLVPGASLVQKAVLGETVDATDLIPGAKFIPLVQNGLASAKTIRKGPRNTGKEKEPTKPDLPPDPPPDNPAPATPPPGFPTSGRDELFAQYLLQKKGISEITQQDNTLLYVTIAGGVGMMVMMGFLTMDK